MSPPGGESGEGQEALEAKAKEYPNNPHPHVNVVILLAQPVMLPTTVVIERILSRIQIRL